VALGTRVGTVRFTCLKCVVTRDWQSSCRLRGREPLHSCTHCSFDRPQIAHLADAGPSGDAVHGAGSVVSPPWEGNHVVTNGERQLGGHHHFPLAQLCPTMAGPTGTPSGSSRT
jgi:hypothetical protein